MVKDDESTPCILGHNNIRMYNLINGMVASNISKTNGKLSYHAISESHQSKCVNCNTKKKERCELNMFAASLYGKARFKNARHEVYRTRTTILAI